MKKQLIFLLVLILCISPVLAYPSVTINNPTSLLNYNKLGSNELLNISYNNVENIWYNYNGTNITLENFFTDSHNQVLNSAGSYGAKLGVLINTTRATTLTKVESPAKNGTIYLQNNNKVSLVNATLVNGVATFNYNLAANTEYYIMYDNMSAAYTIYYQAASSNPYLGTNINWIAGWNGGANMTNELYFISNITTKIPDGNLSTTFILNRATGNNITVWTNDSSNNLNSSSINWSYKVFENSRTYNSSTYETKSEIYSINVTSNSSLTAVNLIWNGTTYSTTKSGEIYSRTFDIPLGNLTKSFYWNFTYVGNLISSDSNNVTIGVMNFGLCNASLTTKFLNLTFKDESDNSIINATIPTSTFTYYLGSGSVNKTYTLINNTVNYEYDFCALPNQTLLVLPYVQYSRDTYPQRIWQPTVQSYSNVATNQTLYLLGSTDGIYVTYQIVNNANQLLSGVTVSAVRDINGISTNVCTGVSSTDGSVVCWLNPDFSTSITFSKSGFTDYVLVHMPTQSSYTVTLGGGATTNNNYFQGITYSILPKGQLYNDTTYSFEFNVTSSFWSLDSFGFNLRLSNGSIVGSASSLISGSPAIFSYNVTNQSIIYMDYYWIINGNYTNASTYWSISNSANTGWSIKYFFTDLNAYINSGIFGLDNFGRYLIVFLIIFMSVGIVSYKYGMTSPLSVSTLTFGIIFFFDIVVDLIPKIRGIDNLLTYISALILILMIFREVER